MPVEVTTKYSHIWQRQQIREGPGGVRKSRYPAAALIQSIRRSRICPQSAQRTFEPRDVPELVELPTDGVEDTDEAESKPLMETGMRGWGG
jgi:hypothetical protein